MICCSSPVWGIPYVTAPHWLAAAVGRYLDASLYATGSICVSGIWLPGKVPPRGLASVTAFPQVAEAMVLKSPFSMAAVGIFVVEDGGFWRFSTPWNPPK